MCVFRFLLVAALEQPLLDSALALQTSSVAQIIIVRLLLAVELANKRELVLDRMLLDIAQVLLTFSVALGVEEAAL